MKEEKFYQQFDLLINFDETAFVYSNNTIYTYDIQEEKGFIFQPFVIIKNKSKNPKSINQLKKELKSQCDITHSDSGWQTNHTMIEYSNYLLEQIKKNFDMDHRKTLLIMDTYKCHQYKEAIEILEKNQISIVYIPGGLTGIFQPIDVTKNKPLKSFMKSKCVDFQLANSSLSSSLINHNNSIPKQSIFLDWICESHQITSEDTIKKSFQQIGFTFFEMDKLQIEYLSTEIKEICSQFIDYLQSYIEQNEYQIQYDPYLDNHQIQIQDLFFNDLIIEPIEEVLQSKKN